MPIVVTCNGCGHSVSYTAEEQVGWLAYWYEHELDHEHPESFTVEVIRPSDEDD